MLAYFYSAHYLLSVSNVFGYILDGRNTIVSDQNRHNPLCHRVYSHIPGDNKHLECSDS